MSKSKTTKIALDDPKADHFLQLLCERGKFTPEEILVAILRRWEHESEAHMGGVDAIVTRINIYLEREI